MTSIRELVAFFLGDLTTTAELSTVNGGALRNPEQLRTLQALLPVLRENQAELRAFGLQIVGRLAGACVVLGALFAVGAALRGGSVAVGGA